jgi:hydroxymethylbilane synthase
MTELRSLDAEILARETSWPRGGDARGRGLGVPPHVRALPLRIGTRGSPLALWQARHFIDLATSLCPVLSESPLFIEHVIATSGDRVQDRRLAEIGGKGLFAKELHEALADGRIDAAVHSLKDLETELPPGIVLACTLKREDCRDALVFAEGRGCDEADPYAAIPRNARVATASVRRQSQLLHARPDLSVEMIRGNVQTRLARLRAEGGPNATLLALAGLNRLGMEHEAHGCIAPHIMVPAACQGIIGITVRADDTDMRGLLAAVEDHDAFIASTAERALLGSLDGSCRTPIGAHATLLEGGRLRLTGLIARADGSFLLKRQLEGAVGDAERLGAELGEELRRDSPADVLAG